MYVVHWSIKGPSVSNTGSERSRRSPEEEEEEEEEEDDEEEDEDDVDDDKVFMKLFDSARAVS